MYQSGIYNISQLSSNLAEASKLPIAIDLYAQINQLDQQKQRLAEEVIMNFAFSDGSYKKTHFNRFDDFDEKVAAYLKNNLAADKKYKIHDMAISDGRTSLNFFSQLEKIFPDFDFLASDKNILVYVLPDVRNKDRKIVKDENGKILQIILPPFVLNIYSPKRALRHKIKKAIFYPINLILTKSMLISPVRGLFIKPNEAEKQKITLLNSQVTELAKTKNNFHIISHDLFQKSSEEFDIIRAMNVINFSYFTPEEVKKIISNILSSLKEGGIFIVGSNKNAGTKVSGDLFIKKGGHLENLEKFGVGAPFREIMLTM